MKIVEYYNDMYKGSLSDEEAQALLSIMSVDSSVGIEALKHCIWNVSEEIMQEMIDYAKVYNSHLPVYESDVELGELTPTQTIGVAYMYTAKRCLVGDSTGYGKTIETAALINLCRVDKQREGKELFYIFLTDKTALYEIQKKLIKRTGEYVHATTGLEKDLNTWFSMCENGMWCSLVASHSVINNPKFFKWLQINSRNIDIFVLDESAVVKNSSSEMYKNVKAIEKLFNRVILLNATPVETNLRDVYNQLSIVDSKLLPTISKFEDEYCKKSYFGNTTYPKVVGFKNEELFKKRIALRYIARTRKEIGARYEGNTGELILSKLSKEQKSLMRRTTMWRIACDCPQALDEDILFEEEYVPKLADLRYLLEEVIPEEETVMVYCYYKKRIHEDLQLFIEMLGMSCEVINGDLTSSNKRTRTLHNINTGHTKVLITNVFRAIDLNGCNNIILYSFDFNPTKMIQVEGRITREVDIVNKHVYLLCSEGKEYKYLKSKIAKRVEMGKKFTNQDYSLITDIVEKILTA